jgi:hypothetical protein
MSDNAAGREKVLELLPTGLTILTTALAAVGGLTGGIARMFRNNPDTASRVFVAIVLAIGLALVAQFIGPGLRFRWVSVSLVLASIALFSVALGDALLMAVHTANVTDRPSLNAELEQSADGLWFIRGDASASGLTADGSLQVYVYAYPANGTVRTQLLQVTAGPDGDGVATQEFAVPAPSGAEYQSIVLTAAVGEKVRYCDGKPLQVGAKFTENNVAEDEGNNSCMVLRPPPR